MKISKIRFLMKICLIILIRNLSLRKNNKQQLTKKYIEYINKSSKLYFYHRTLANNAKLLFYFTLVSIT